MPFERRGNFQKLNWRDNGVNDHPTLSYKFKMH